MEGLFWTTPHRQLFNFAFVAPFLAEDEVAAYHWFWFILFT